MAIPPVVIDFKLRGVDEAMAAFRSVGDRLVGYERATSAEAARQARARTSTTDREAKAREAVEARERREREREYTALFKEIESKEKAATKATEREARERSRAEQDAAKEKVRTMIAADREVARAKSDVLRQMQREEEQANRDAIAWVHKREQEELAAGRRRAATAGRFLRATTSGVSAVGHDVFQGARAVTSLVTDSMGGGFDLGRSVQKATRAAGEAADIANSGLNLASDDARDHKKESVSNIQKVSRTVAVEHGLDSDDAQAALMKFTGLSGQLHKGMDLLPQLAELSRATGSSLSDLAEAAGNVSLNLGAADADGSKTMLVLRGLASQGKAGAVEVRDLAKEIAKLSAASGKFDGDAADNMLKMGALAQEARGEGGAFSASVAANAVRGFAGTLQTGARVRAFAGTVDPTTGKGIDVYSDKSRTRFKAPEELIVESLRATGGDKLKMNALFKNVLADEAVSGFSKRFTDAGGGQKGEQAVRQRFQELYKGNLMSTSEVKQAAGEREQEADAKMAKIVAEFDRAVAEQIIPELMRLLPVIQDMIPLFVDVAKNGIPAFIDLIKTVSEFVTGHRAWIQSMSENPVGTIIAAEVIKSIGSAAIGQLVGKALEGSIASRAAGGFAIAAAAFAIEQAGEIVISKMADEDANKQRGQIGTDMSAENMASTLGAESRSGKLSKDDVAKAKVRADELRQQIEGEKQDAANPSTFRRLFGGIAHLHESLGGSLGGGDTAQGMGDKEQAEQARSLKNSVDALNLLTDAIKKSELALKDHARTAGNGMPALPAGKSDPSHPARSQGL